MNFDPVLLEIIDFHCFLRNRSVSSDTIRFFHSFVKRLDNLVQNLEKYRRIEIVFELSWIFKVAIFKIQNYLQ